MFGIARWAVLCGLVAALAGCVQADRPALDYGTVEQVRPADAPGENTGVGALIGAAAGGAIGSQIGSGSGNVAATLVGIVAGAAAGSATEGALQSASGLQYTVRLDDGRVLTVVQHREPGEHVLPPGTHVVVRTVGRFQRVLPATADAAAH
jgi:outer membrane lipoprotein SlyB